MTTNVRSGIATLITLAMATFVLASGTAAAGPSERAEERVRATLAAVNERLAAASADYRVVQVELLSTDPVSPNVVVASDRGNKQLPFHFVPGDARRVWSPSSTPGNPGISYVVDAVDAIALGPVPPAATEAAIDRASTTWDTGTPSTNVPMVKVLAPAAIDVGVVEFLSTFGGSGSPFTFADIQHGGWLPGLLAPPFLAGTFTFGWCAPCGLSPVFTDIDKNGKFDTAFREIYYSYSDVVLWGINTGPGLFGPFDVETVALHEIGHGLSQAHFGNVIFNTQTGTLQAAPRAVMNAVYLGQQQTLLSTDLGGHSSIWASWPVR